MRKSKQIFYEAILIITASLLLGVAYTFVTKQGFFAKAKPAATMEMISLDKAKELFGSKKAIFIDARHEYEYLASHIPNAINIPVKEFDARQDRLSNILKNKILVVYCDGAECNSSVELSTKLVDSGFTNVMIFFGGWQEWINSNLPVEK